MTQPQFADGPPVPLMVEGLIDAETLQRLFADLSAAASILGVREKGSPTEYTSAGDQQPEAALHRLLSGAARAIQIRYHYDDHDWTDTILAQPGGFRVIRCRHEPGS